MLIVLALPDGRKMAIDTDNIHHFAEMPKKSGVKSKAVITTKAGVELFVDTEFTAILEAMNHARHFYPSSRDVSRSKVGCASVGETAAAGRVRRRTLRRKHALVRGAWGLD